ncbi:MAG: protein-L-isoaspartate(D-aspartate) O-methyltransferase [Proteobacteria bacterium]|nr:protein-L-isoaspartate(D-aspartate) O-methyltransferase [Pseudomonadota bacterium]
MVSSLRFKKDIYERVRHQMVERQVVARGVKDRAVIEAMQKVPRHLFVEEALYGQAYSDYPLPIGEKQTISQPYIVGFMTEALGLNGTERVLEIGTGSGYQASVLSLCAEKVYSVERISRVADRARKILDSFYCSNVLIRVADGTLGWEDEAPFDAIIVTAGAPAVPDSLVDQLKTGGRLVIPVGDKDVQELIKITKREDRLVTERLGGCRFVRLIGKKGWEKEKGD